MRAVRHDRVRGLHEVKRRLTIRIRAGLARVRRVVPADAVNAVHGKLATAVGYCDAGFRNLEHFSLSLEAWLRNVGLVTAIGTAV
jgi:hypothetical protein